MNRIRLLALALFLVITGFAQAVDIEEVVWGFDGKVVPYRFNPVSVLVSNASEEPAPVRLSLFRALGADRMGASIEEDVFLTANESRWVQFYPFVSNQKDEWTVSWGLLPNQRKEFMSPDFGPPARIELTDSSALNQTKKTGVKAYPDELFPTFVSATDTLEAVYLDHSPRWLVPQRRLAFIDWIKRGGTLFVVPNSSGQYPTFTSELAALNSPLERLRIGQGQVIRSASKAAAMELADDPTKNLLPVRAEPSLSSSDLASSAFRNLKTITTPDHNWWLIHAISLLYLGLVFPGWYILAKQNVNFRITLLAFVGIAAIATLLFNVIGRRGYGESTTVNSVAIARQIEPGRYDVHQWTNVFVTVGDVYDLEFEGEGDLYTTNSFEKVPAKIDNGVNGSFRAEIPLFSSMPFVHAGTAEGPTWEVEVEEADRIANGPDEDYETEYFELASLRLKVTPMPLAHEAFVVFGHMKYNLRVDDGLFVLGEGMPIDDYQADQANYHNSYSYNQNKDKDTRAETMLNSLRDLLLARSLGTINRKVFPPITLPNDRLRLFIFDRMPETFSVKNPSLNTGKGKVLYSIDAWLPDSED